MYEVTKGPWHAGYAATCEVLGSYVTIVASSPDVAAAIAQLVATAGPWEEPQPAMVGRWPVIELPTTRRRIR